jgi:glycosyltransferase involved in cell wall biosynthesis
MTCESLHMVALVGRRDKPTDALRDYCDWLGQALTRSGVALELVEVNLDREKTSTALVQLWMRSKAWKGRWVLMQYTALSWSRRGFAFAALAVVWVLHRRGARTAIVFHDSQGARGDRIIDLIRRACQHWTMRRIYRLADRSIFTIPIDKIAWLAESPSKAIFIPIGANIPESFARTKEASLPSNQPKTVAVFGVTGGSRIDREVQDIAHAMRYARKNHPRLHLMVLGRNSVEAEESLRRALEGVDLRITIFGLLAAQEITDVLSHSDVLLFVRGPISATRGTAIAAIACGLPIVAFEGPDTCFPITEAGLCLAPYHDRDALAAALDQVLSDDGFRQGLCRRSLTAHARYFSWQKIAERFVEELANG